MSPYIRALTQAYVANAQSTLAIRSVFPNNLANNFDFVNIQCQC